MTRLLVSVRNAVEALDALAGGAHLIDVKEPSRGSLGRADEATLAEIVQIVAGRRPLSAALGELVDAPTLPSRVEALHFVKWGLSRFRGKEELAWNELRRQAKQLASLNTHCTLVTVAYADAEGADAPAVEAVSAQLIETGQGVLLLDTFEKDGRNLLDWLNLTELKYLVERCHQARVRVALAGSLGFEEIKTLLPLRPDWFAVRGAVCHDRQRTAAVDSARVRQLIEVL